MVGLLFCRFGVVECPPERMYKGMMDEKWTTELIFNTSLTLSHSILKFLWPELSFSRSFKFPDEIHKRWLQQLRRAEKGILIKIKMFI